MERQPQEGKVYREIKLADSVQINRKSVQKGLDGLLDSLEKSNGYKVVGIYEANMKKLEMECDKGHSFSMIPSNFKRGYRCPVCAGNCPKQSIENFHKLANLEGYKIVGKYETARKKIEMECDKGHSFSMTPDNYKRGHRCPACTGHCPVQAKEDYFKLAKLEGFKVVGDYEAALKPIKMECDKGHSISITPNNFKKGNRCWHCNGTSPEQGRENFYALLELAKYKAIGEYIKASKKVKIQCDKGHSFSMTPNHFKHGERCPVCSESNGEKIVREWLESKSIIYKTQYIFPMDTKKYDFLLPFENIIIEVNGKQHYEEVDFSGKGKGRTLAQEQANDKVKQKFAENLGYKYIVVDYRESKPQLALERFIHAFNKLKAEKTVDIDG
ncbi:hypothetical protein [Bacillus sp. AFS088145]|uniref:hypothetical protein n=1 Tax=Bacillus sp. AFS088145 TaxID=2033514 RepID=UPI000BF456D0|nr:hypothetical protein [Bacillus sp. AFS088145]PFH86468.1 hypothetical protein COI44_12680 [Bacillus sp. AFS088145]